MATGDDSKVCRTCGISKPLSDFSKKERGILGVRPDCKVCAAMAKRTRYATDEAYRRAVIESQKLRCVTPEDGYRKRCPACGETKPFHEFYRSKAHRDNCSAYCKRCQNLRSTSYARENKANILLMGYSLRTRYGITPEDYAAMMDRQDHRCAICGTAECKTGRNFSVDHCHVTGRVRGLLCADCNKGIGSLRDDVNLLAKAIEYLNTADTGFTGKPPLKRRRKQMQMALLAGTP
jgi:hypothetical protein